MRHRPSLYRLVHRVIMPLARRMQQHYAVASTPILLVGWFSGLILIGSLLLWLPWAHHGHVGMLDALFTSTSAVCVTGLIVVDTGSEFTPFGQVILLMLIQLGGLGVMTFASIALQIIGKRLPLASQAALEDSIFQRDAATEFGRIFNRIFRLVLALEGLGALVLFALFAREEPLLHAAWLAIFHSISAFCNAGFSLHATSLERYHDAPAVLTVIMLLIIFGGLGHTVLRELYDRCWTRRRTTAEHYAGPISIQTRLVLWVSGILIVVGMVGFLLMGLTPSGTGGWFAGALFQSVSARTAGFNSIPLDHMPHGGLMLLTLLMFIGGSPGSCAGGVKTTTFAIWLSCVRSGLSDREGVVLFGRSISATITRRAVLLIGVGILWCFCGTLFLAAQEGHRHSLAELLFEQVSAFGTVGLSTGITASLGPWARLWIILTMFVGRLGPLTVALWMVPRSRAAVGYPEGRIMIG